MKLERQEQAKAQSSENMVSVHTHTRVGIMAFTDDLWPLITLCTELRQHTSLFGQDTPTETQRLESCVKELKRVVSCSVEAINKAHKMNEAFWTR